MLKHPDQPRALSHIAPLREKVLAPSGPDYALNVVVVYEDAPTREWAVEVCERVGRLVGSDSVRATWWNLGELPQPAVLAGAVSTAIRADVVIVAIHAAEGFPLPFYVWVDSWLPHHTQPSAALVALVALPERPSLQLERALDYLRAMSRQGGLDFLIEERKLSAPTTALLPEQPTHAQRPACSSAAGGTRARPRPLAVRSWALSGRLIKSAAAA